MSKNPERESTVGHPTLENSLQELLKRLRLKLGKNTKAWDAYWRGRVSGVMLDTTVTMKHHRPFLSLDGSLADFRSLKVEEFAAIAEGAAPSKGDNGVPFRKEYQRISTELDVEIIRSLWKSNHLGAFMQTDDDSPLGWMFCRPEELDSEEDAGVWARRALDNKRSYFHGVYRFWQIFLDAGVQGHVVDHLALQLPMVALAYGDYRATLKICGGYLKEISTERSIEDVCMWAFLCTHRASALSCLGHDDTAEPIYEKVLATLGQHLKGRPKAGIRADRDALDLDLRMRVCRREQLRSRIRPVWPKLTTKEWLLPPEDVKPDDRLWSDEQRKEMTTLRDELELAMRSSRVALDPTDFDTLARITLFLEAHDAKALTRVERMIDDMWARYDVVISQAESTEGSLFCRDSLQTTEALYWIARRDRTKATERLDEIVKEMPLDERHHTSVYVRTLLALRDRLPI